MKDYQFWYIVGMMFIAPPGQSLSGLIVGVLWLIAGAITQFASWGKK